ncbi:MAG: ferredoxin [Rubrobacteraceae bacterium]|mgnify:CR=1 FL=1|uniref:ferredoxin n=1 Tax=Rubrobacter TaxID=42255 RepID=UPI00235F7F3D|nr:MULTISPECIES: ferredoxin [Rubrobacter]MBX6764403.1 ferredoxin [Rubrobacteraceae bacterium]MCL6437018.1 ferredoxin [Rubrobacteraceae bacterium]
MDGKLEVEVDLDLCQSCGECARIAPEIFTLGEDDVLRWRPEAEISLEEKAREAEEACPTTAIKVEVVR